VVGNTTVSAEIDAPAHTYEPLTDSLSRHVLCCCVLCCAVLCCAVLWCGVVWCAAMRCAQFNIRSDVNMSGQVWYGGGNGVRVRRGPEQTAGSTVGWSDIACLSGPSYSGDDSTSTVFIARNTLSGSFVTSTVMHLDGASLDGAVLGTGSLSARLSLRGRNTVSLSSNVKFAFFIPTNPLLCTPSAPQLHSPSVLCSDRDWLCAVL
jgi:hypothetical protein